MTTKQIEKFVELHQRLNSVSNNILSINELKEETKSIICDHKYPDGSSAKDVRNVCIICFKD